MAHAVPAGDRLPPARAVRGAEPMRRAGSDPRLRSRHRPGNPRPALHRSQDLQRRVDGVRRRAQHAGLRGRPGAAGHAAGAEPWRGRARDPLRAGGRTRRSRRGRSSRARTTSIPTCPRATRSASTRCRWCRAATSSFCLGERSKKRSPDARAPGRGCRQVAARGLPRPDRHRPEPRRHAAAGDRHRARHARQRRGGGIRQGAARAGDVARHLRRQHAGRQLPLRRQRVGAPARRSRSARGARSRT